MKHLLIICLTFTSGFFIKSGQADKTIMYSQPVHVEVPIIYFYDLEWYKELEVKEVKQTRVAVKSFPYEIDPIANDTSVGLYRYIKQKNEIETNFMFKGDSLETPIKWPSESLRCPGVKSVMSCNNLGLITNFQNVEYTYEKGKVVSKKEERIFVSDTFQIITTYHYDQLGIISRGEEKSYLHDTLISTDNLSYQVNSLGNIISVEKVPNSNISSYQYVYEYDEKGRLTSAASFQAGHLRIMIRNEYR